MNAGFIGLGVLGRTIAQRLIDQDVALTVWNRTPGKAEGLRADVAASPAEVIARTPVVFLNLRDSAAVDAVLNGDHGLLSGDVHGKIIIDTTTNHFVDVTRFHAAVSARGGSYLEAPVLGSVVPASKGALTVVVSGEQAAFEQAKPLIEKIGSTIFFLGEAGLASKMKLVNNLVLGTFMAVLGEAVTMGEAAGIEKARVIEILAAGAGNSGVLNAKRQKLLDEDFAPHFSAALIYKDLHYLQDLARSLDRPLFTGSAVKELYALALQRGVADQDFSVIYDLLKGK